MKPRRAAPGKQLPGDTGPTIMTKAPQTLAEALDVIRSMHHDLLAFRNPEFDLITPGREGEFDDRVKAVLAHSAPVFKADCAAALPEASSSTKSQSQCLSFGDALKALKAGQRVARTGWNGKGMWLAYTPGSEFAPERAKPGHAAAFRAKEAPHEDVRLLPHIDMRAADGSMVIGWLASQTDMLADDWMVLA